MDDLSGLVVDNPKLRSATGSEADWAPHPGFTLLFDNVDVLSGGVGPAGLLATDVAKTPFYAALWHWIQTLDVPGLRAQYGFAALPPSSYHVTAWDGLNPVVLPRANAQTQQQAASALGALPTSFIEFGQQLQATADALSAIGPVRFVLDGLWATVGVGMVAGLAPASVEDAEPFAAFQAERLAWATRWQARWGTAYLTPLRPHVTLAYFANKALGHVIEQNVPQWNVQLQERLQGVSLTLQQVSVYSFTDMIRFYRVR